MTGRLLDVRDLRVTVGSKPSVREAVRGVSFHVDRGERVGIVGESGCGKTLTGLAVAGLLGRDGQHPAVQVHEPGSSGPGGQGGGKRGPSAGMIFQDPMASLNPVRRVMDQVSEVVACRGIPGADARARASALLGEVGFSDPAAVGRLFPHQLSGGMAQRVAIAAALASDPPLLVADEPTTALDVLSERVVLSLLQEVQRSRDMGLLLISHDLSLVASFCHRVLVMYAGRIVEEGHSAKILDAPQHPYSRALLEAVPNPGSRVLPAPIPGRVPSPGEDPGGCAFHPRCPISTAICSQVRPLPEPALHGGIVECFEAANPEGDAGVGEASSREVDGV
jgi:oligopeptide/dipeptide ABC transporter ATP-binding protein